MAELKRFISGICRRHSDLSASGSIGSGNAIWFAMPITEFIVVVYVVHEMIKYTKQLSAERMG